MAFFKGQKEPVPEVETNIWACTSGDCSGWMREDFVLEDNQSCPLCSSTMSKEVRVLPVIET